MLSLLPVERVREIARETGFVKRERDVDPVAFLWVLVLGFGVRMQRTFESWRKRYQEETGDDLSYGSWYPRFSAGLVRFTRECVVLAMQNLASGVTRSLGERLQRFKDIMIQDGSVIRLHEKLAKRWPATRSRKVAAGVKVALLVSAVANGPKNVTIHGERTPDAKTLRVGSWVRDRILLIDLGFYKFQMFARIAENGGFFVSRLKENANPLILFSHIVHRGRAIDLSGKTWQEVEPLLRREVLDAEVEISFRRRGYAGKRSGDTMRVRLVAVWNDEARKYHVYITNITPDVLTPEEVAALYAVRWDIELVFKELKSCYAMDEIKTTNHHAVLALIWVAILTLIVSRRYYNVLIAPLPVERRTRYTSLRWARVFAESADKLLVITLDRLGLARNDGIDAGRLAELQMKNALDPHVNRRRLKDGWVA
jgi:IS4 transposase